jgi:4-amino-4-deoxy-L-arabinose transferase-like glycosyltransferase
VLLGGWVAARAIAYGAGLRFNREVLSEDWHFLPLSLLRHDFARSIWWSHAQPPLFNILIGGVIRLPTRLQVPAFVVVMLASGLVIVLAMYALARRLGVPRWPAVATALVFGISPAAIVYEQLPSYDYAVAAALCLTFFGLARYLASGSRRWAVLCFGAATAVVLLRPTYHLVWLIALVVVVLVARPADRRRTIAVALLPLALTATLFVKNLVLFDTFTSSSWFGMNLAHMARFRVPDSRLPPVLRVGPFQSPETYGAATRRPTGVAALDQRYKPGGIPNYNNIVYVDASEKYLRASAAFLRAHPVKYARTVRASLEYFFTPAIAQPSGYKVVRPGNDAVRVYDAVLGGQPRAFEYFAADRGQLRKQVPERSQLSWLIVGVYAVALAALPAMAWGARRRTGVTAVWRAWVLAAASATIWMAMLGGTLFDIDENSRFRMETDPLALVVAVAMVATLVRRRATTRRPSELASVCGP